MRIRPPRAAELVADHIRRRILSGQLAEGLPTEVVLLEEFSVSRPTMREALRILETEGLVRTRRGKQGGAVVRRPTVDTAAYHVGLVLQGSGVDLRDLADARMLLEPLCAAMAAGRPDRKKVAAELDRLTDASEKLLGRGEEFTSSLLEFHEALVAACGSQTLRVLVGTMERVWQGQERAWAAEASERGSYPDVEGQKKALESHRRIARRIAEGDDEGASRDSRKHLAASMDFVCGSLSGEDSPDSSRVVDAALLRV